MTAIWNISTKDKHMVGFVKEKFDRFYSLKGLN
jgi:hypothetical protein